VDHLNRESSSAENPPAADAHAQPAFSVLTRPALSVTRPALSVTRPALSVTRPATCLGPAAGAHYCCLLDMLREEEGEEEEGEEEKISQEEIQLFHSRLPYLSSEREKLR
jgi:hypothetical protein